MSVCCLTCGIGITGILVNSPLTGAVDPLTGILNISALSSTIAPPTTVPATASELINISSGGGFTILSFDRSRFKDEVFAAIEVVGLTKAQDINGDTVIGGGSFNIIGTTGRVSVSPIVGGKQIDIIGGGINDQMAAALFGDLDVSQFGPGNSVQLTLNQSAFDGKITTSGLNFNTRMFAGVDLVASLNGGVEVGTFLSDLTFKVADTSGFRATTFLAIDKINSSLNGIEVTDNLILGDPIVFKIDTPSLRQRLLASCLLPTAAVTFDDNFVSAGPIRVLLTEPTSTDGSIDRSTATSASVTDLTVNVAKSRDRLFASLFPLAPITKAQAGPGGVVVIAKTPDAVFSSITPLIHSQAYLPGDTFSMPISLGVYSQAVEGSLTLDMVISESVANPANAWTMEILRKSGPPGGPYTADSKELTHGGLALSAPGVILSPLPTGLGHVSKTVFDVLPASLDEWQHEAHFRLDATVGVATTLTVVGSVGVPVSVARSHYRVIG